MTVIDEATAAAAADHTRPQRRSPVAPTPLPRGVEPAVVALAVTTYCAAVGLAIHHAAPIYLPPDAAHALGEADVLLGRGVLDFAHPPAFAAVVALSRALFGAVPGVLAAFLTALAVLWLAIYVLLRQWVGPLAALVGTFTGMALPLVAELVGWGGGSQLLGIGLGVSTLAAFERWARRGRGAFLVGIGVGLTSLAHPFALIALAACLATRWAVEMHARPDVAPGRLAPTRLRGALVALAAAAPLLLVGIPYYGAVSTPGEVALGPPTLSSLTDLLAWATRENTLLLVLCLASFGTALFARLRGPAALSATLTALIVLPLVVVRADAGYLTRSLYYLPVLLAIGVAIGWTTVAAAVSPHLDRARRIGLAVVAGLLLPGLVASLGLGPRFRAAIPYYSVLGSAEADDIAALRGGTGAVATSWSGNSVATGAGMSWYVSGLAGRRAYGPSGPWIGVQPAEQRDGTAMQQAFSGVAGVDGGGVQAAGRGPDIAVQVRVPGIYRDFAFPAFVAGTTREATSAQADVRLDDGAVTTASAGQAITATVIDDRVVLEATGGPGGLPTVWLRLPPGAAWNAGGPPGETLHVEQDIAGRRISFDLASSRPGSRFAVVPADITGGQAIRVDVPNGAPATITVTTSGTAPAQAAVGYRRRDIFADYDITNVVEFRSAGIVDDFDPACFPRAAATPVLIVLGVDPACR